MLTSLRINHFRQLDSAEIELGQNVVLIGPNNSGKTSALQSLSLWEIGLKRWVEKHGLDPSGKKRPGVALNRSEFHSIPLPSTRELFHNLGIRKQGKSNNPEHINIEIEVTGISGNRIWACPLEFDYSNDESVYVRPVRQEDGTQAPIPDASTKVQVAYLPPMSGLTDVEYRKEIGETNVLIGQGRTAEVLRNLCLMVYEKNGEDGRWNKLKKQMHSLFGIALLDPVYNPTRSTINISYEENNAKLDLSCSGRGLQQTLLLLSYLYCHPASVLLLDEPDAHLEILRQRQIYNEITSTAEEQNAQVIAASHSEVVLNEAAEKDVVIAFLGSPHRIDDRGSQLLKSLKAIPYSDYFQAEEKGWVLYLEGSTDLSILRSIAKKLNHPASNILETAFVYYIGSNECSKIRDHFHGLREAKEDLKGIAILDRIEQLPDESGHLTIMCWKKREIENYFSTREVLLRYASQGMESDDMVEQAEAKRRLPVIEKTIDEIESALKTLGNDPWGDDIKVSDEFLDKLFSHYFEKLGVPNEMRKTNYHRLTEFLDPDDIDPEMIEKLNAVVETAKSAQSISIPGDNTI